MFFDSFRIHILGVNYYIRRRMIKYNGKNEYFTNSNLDRQKKKLMLEIDFSSRSLSVPTNNNNNNSDRKRQ